MSDPRITFGFARTECACGECALNCRYIPGYLIPTDLDAMAAHLGYESVLTFALENLLASPGATVMADGQVFQIPTLVPARQVNGACKFLTTESRCAIHAVSPFGCSHFDVHQSKTEADERRKSWLEDAKAYALAYQRRYGQHNWGFKCGTRHHKKQRVGRYACTTLYPGGKK